MHLAKRWWRRWPLVALTACGDARPTMAEPEPPPAAMSALAAQYLTELLTLMEARSVNRKAIDWPKLGSAVRTAAAGAQTIAQTYPAIRTALVGLADGHSFYQTAGGAIISAGGTSCFGQAAATLPLASDIGYVRVPAFSGGVPESRAMATQLQQGIRARDTGTVSGWIVDLRENGGGNMWPMLAGVGPVLGDGLAGHFVDPEGSATPWGYVDGAAYLDTRRIVVIDSPYVLRAPNPRVAVLIDGGVASSGEAIAIAFKGRSSVRFFGLPTCGVSTANQAHGLSDGATLVLTVSTMADRQRVLYGRRVAPDEQLIGLGELFTRATEWLRVGR